MFDAPDDSTSMRRLRTAPSTRCELANRGKMFPPASARRAPRAGGRSDDGRAARCRTPVREHPRGAPVAAAARSRRSRRRRGRRAARSSPGCAAIVEYDPRELTFTALAGTPVRVVQAALAAHGQYLPFDPPLAARGATLGGVVAAGTCGPGRYRYGGVRDFVIGARFVDGTGALVVRGGGRWSRTPPASTSRS